MDRGGRGRGRRGGLVIGAGEKVTEDGSGIGRERSCC